MCTQTLTRHQVNRRCISPSLAELCIGNVVMVNENKKKMYVYMYNNIYALCYSNALDDGNEIKTKKNIVVEGEKNRTFFSMCALHVKVKACTSTGTFCICNGGRGRSRRARRRRRTEQK